MKYAEASETFQRTLRSVPFCSVQFSTPLICNLSVSMYSITVVAQWFIFFSLILSSHLSKLLSLQNPENSSNLSQCTLDSQTNTYRGNRPELEYNYINQQIPLLILIYFPHIFLKTVSRNHV